MTAPKLEISPEITAALLAGRAVVALESTIIAHGMPYPNNLETAIALETIVRAKGAVPATIAVLAGKVRVGLGQSDLERIARNPAIAKASIRDLPLLMARGQDGATTVAATMRVAAIAGISVFATGGIGGVHRGWEHTFDVSADLTELAASSVNVVCAGAKSILDVPATLEQLETMGVPVIVYDSDEFPAFYSRQSGIKSPSRCDRIDELVTIIRAKNAIGMKSGVLIANPIPIEHEIPAREMAAYIDQAIAAATKAGISGKAVTPFLLAEIAKQSEGRSLEANMALARNNAELAGELALALSQPR